MQVLGVRGRFRTVSGTFRDRAGVELGLMWDRVGRVLGSFCIDFEWFWDLLGILCNDTKIIHACSCVLTVRPVWRRAHEDLGLTSGGHESEDFQSLAE